MTTEGCFRDFESDPAEAQSLWNALARARADYAPRVLAAAEDAVFRWYLPLARTLASGAAGTAADPIAVEQAAELGLAQAVLGWPRADCGGFERFARTMIAERVRCCAAPRTRRSMPAPPALSLLPVQASPGSGR